MQPGRTTNRVARGFFLLLFEDPLRMLPVGAAVATPIARASPPPLRLPHAAVAGGRGRGTKAQLLLHEALLSLRLDLGLRDGDAVVLAEAGGRYAARDEPVLVVGVAGDRGRRRRGRCVLLLLLLPRHPAGRGAHELQARLAAAAAVVPRGGGHVVRGRGAARLAGPQLVILVAGTAVAPVVVAEPVPALRQPPVLVHHVHLLRHEDLAQALRQHRPEDRDRRADARQVHLDGRQHDAPGPVPRRVDDRVRGHPGLDQGLQAPYARDVDAG